MSELRTWVVDQLTTLLPNNDTVIASNSQTTLFREWTGWDHVSLKAQWAGELQYCDANGNPKAITTTCNAFISMLVNKIRIAGGQTITPFQSFNLPVAGQSAWYWYPDENWVPEAGDLFQLGTRGGRYKHVGVILEIDSGIWTTAEAGQGGPRMGFDMIKRIGPRLFPPPLFMGWIDIDAYFLDWTNLNT